MTMATWTHKSMIAIVLAIALSAVVVFAPPAAAAKNVTINLYVGTGSGWGLTNTSLSIPGPTLRVGWGDNVTLILNATSGANHRWYLDYNNDAIRSASEPQSPTFSAGASAISWNFTASQNGTFVYRDRAASTLWGLIIVGASSTTTTPSPVETANVLVVGIVAAVVAAAVGLVVGWYLGRRPERTPPPPEGGQT